MIEELVSLHQKGIQVRLITTDTLENTHQKQLESIKRLIVQERVVDERAQGYAPAMDGDGEVSHPC